MKKKILSGIFALALLGATGYGVNQSLKSDADLSDLALMNVEALANGEGSPNVECSTLCSDEWCGGIYIDGVYFYLHYCVFI
ncbi:MAG: hypothetical protein XD81_1134 [Bacteroidetes bacterium 38_7]|jgi:hypothetical protein|nr:MAG: hypothetical protein XD81_1134 [Bacteroidetes bacterium 38_7]